MKMPHLLLSTVAVLLLHTAGARAQEEFLGEAAATPPTAAEASEAPATGIEAARDIRHNGLQVGLYKGFFSPIGVYRDGTLLDIGIFGGDAGRYFESSPVVAGHLQDYHTQKIAGVALWSAGMAALVADIVLVCAQSSDRNVLRDNEVTYWSLLGGGAITSLVGAVVMGSANHSLENAVNSHNNDLLNKYLPTAERR